MGNRRTNLLLLLLLAAATTLLYARSRLAALRDDALLSERDLAECRGYLAEILVTGGESGGSGAVTGDAAGQDIGRQLREAAAAAGAAEELMSIEPGNTESVAGSTESSVFLHLEPIAMRQLVTFIDRFTLAHGAARAKTIELEAAPSEASGDTWIADVAIGYPAASNGSNEGDYVEKQ